MTATPRDTDSDRSPAVLPDPQLRMTCRLVPAPHPAAIAVETLLGQCQLRTQRRSGPGGQHRNKTSSGVFLTHQPSGLVGEATERRSQAQNRAVALDRLRLRLAVELRTPSIFDAEPLSDEADIRQQYRGTKLRVAGSNPTRPAIMALVLNDLLAAGGQPSLVANQWSTHTGAVVGLVRAHHPAMELVNAIRSHHGRPPLK